MKKSLQFSIGIFAIISQIGFELNAQDLEPRSLSNAPVKTKFIVAGYGYGTGNILLDSALPIEDLNSQINTSFLGYVRSIDFFGMSGKYSLILPYASANYNAMVEGIDSTVHKKGLGDATLGFSFNFIGSPAFSISEYQNYELSTIVGLQFKLRVPIGAYDNDKLINLGTNRFVLKTQVGASHKLHKWIFEGYTSIHYFFNNTAFWGNNTLEQKPFYTVKGHIIRSFKNGFWAELGIGYGAGAQTFLNGVQRNVMISGYRMGGTLAYAINMNHSLKFSFAANKRLKQGPDFNALALSYQYRWINKKQ